MNASKPLIALAAVALCASAQADLTYTFNSEVEGFAGVSWSSGLPGWAGGGVIKATTAVGGWTLGTGNAIKKEFNWVPGGGVTIEQVEMQNLAASGNARFAFDIILDASSFPVDDGNWYELNLAANSGGANGWTQVNKLTGDAWRNAGDTTTFTQHFDYSFAQLGWDEGDGWYQTWFGSNSGAGKPIQFYLDNVTAYMVPEPGFFALAGLAAGLLALRRRD